MLTGLNSIIDNQQVNWQKVSGLIPVIVQDVFNLKVLMLGYMNQEALAKTQESKKVTFYSRTKKRLWTKGETSGNYLIVKGIALDCDQDSILIRAQPLGPTCHRGSNSCFEVSSPETQDAKASLPIEKSMSQLEYVIDQRYQAWQVNSNITSQSYTAHLFDQGINKIAQKVGEEGVEVALAAVAESDKEVMNESADLFYHLLVMLKARNIPLASVCAVLEQRMR